MKSIPTLNPSSADVARVGYLHDYISGIEVKATPEEVDAVQVFSRRLVEDYHYPAVNIQTRPQFGVRRSPSDEAKSYPVDIALFSKKDHLEQNLFMVVECKKKNRRDGVAQLKLYLDMSPAELGVWFNGEDHVYLRKVHLKNGGREYVDLPNIPRFGQRIDDIGLYKRSDLVRPSNLRAVFRDIRNHLAGMTTGITRDEALASEIINILFCKILDEQETDPDDMVNFRAGINENAKTIKKRIEGIFDRVKNKAFGDVFRAQDALNLDAESVRYVVGELQTYCVMDAERDAVGDAFEVFIGPALRGAEGQFFTPRNVVKMVIDIIDPKPGELIIDPACGSGGFLISALDHVWNHVRDEAKRKKWSEKQTVQREVSVATDCFRGLDKDAFLAKVCKAYMALIGDGRGGVFCENSLEDPAEWGQATQIKVAMGTFDVVVTNPPFGAKIAVKGSNILSQYALGRKWKKAKTAEAFEQTSTLETKRAPQILFIERCFQLLKPGGRMGIILPESILGNPSYGFLLDYLASVGTILGVVTLPEALFKTSGKGGTHTKVAAVFIRKGGGAVGDVFMSDVKWCGHDSRGNPTMRNDPITGIPTLLDEVPLVAARYHALTKGRSAEDHLGFKLHRSKLSSKILVPKYYDPEIQAAIESVKETHDIVTIDDLVKSKVLSVRTGVEPGKMAYGTGTIPFIRTSDMSSWEIRADFKHGVSEDIYNQWHSKCDVIAGDIFMVRDGTYLIGSSAIVTESDLPMLFQSHIFRIRVLKPKQLSPWLLFACLNAPLVKRQIKAKQFTQDIIDTLGKRLGEIVIPIPRDAKLSKRIANEVKEVVETRAAMRKRVKDISLSVQGLDRPDEEDLSAISTM